MRDFRGFGGIGADFVNVTQVQGNEEVIGRSKGMMPSWPDGATGSNSQSSCSRYHPYARKKHPGENVLRLLALREVAPSVKRPLRRLWADTAASRIMYPGHYREVTDAKRALISWSEAESLRHCTAKYCPLQPAPRSTIAAAFSPDGNTLASTHGDHTVKIICCRTGHCLKVLSGHRRTPWVVRFHPASSEVLASGSLDNEVRLWDANTAECVGFKDFYRPIASLAFHAQGDLLAVASGHKLFIWQYTKRDEAGAPVIVLRTRRSLRAVHFHPHAAPLLLTAEVNDLDSPDCQMTIATSRGLGRIIDSQSVALAEVPAGAASTDDDAEEGCDLALDSERDTSFHLHTSDFSSAAPMDVSPRPSYVELSSPAPSTSDAADIGSVESVLPSSSLVEETFGAQNVSQRPLAGDPGRSSPTVVGAPWDVGEAAAVASSARPTVFPIVPLPRRHWEVGVSGQGPVIWPVSSSSSMSSQVLTPGAMVPQSLPHTGDFSGLELPFLPGLVQGQTHAGGIGQTPASSAAGVLHSMGAGVAQGEPRIPLQNQPVTVTNAAALAALASAARLGSGNTQVGGLVQGLVSHPGVRLTINQTPTPVQGIAIPSIGDVEAAQAAMAAAELPCTVKLRIWPHDIKSPSDLLDPETCRLTIPHAVLCSEMGAHFSPCGRFLAACVACVLPPAESDQQGSRGMNGSPGAGISVHSPTQHPISAQQVIYELRVYSLEEATFGQVLASRAVRAAHCLTSIQFSPTSEHILLAYGRRHSSLLRSLVMDGSQTIPIYTILEVYRVSDMELVRVLPSAEDEVNVACFHPRVGGGLVYGTKEGKLRILCHDRTPRHLDTRRMHELENELLEAEQADPLSFGFVPDMDEPI